MNDNEKDKEIKKTSEAYSYEDYEGEEMENAEEGPGFEEVSESEGSLLIDICQTHRGVSVSESREFEPGSSPYSEEARKKLLLREKWLTITGKKPRNIPVLRKQYDEFSEKFIFFGDRKPKQADQEIMRKLLISSRMMDGESSLKYGKVHQEFMLPALSSGMMCVRFQPGAQILANSDRRGEVQVRKTSSGEVMLTLKTLEYAEGLPVRTLRFFLDTVKLYAAGDCGIIQVFNVEDGELLSASESMSTINNMDISPDGNFLATGGKEGRINIVDPETLQVTSTRSWPANEALQPNVHDEYHRLRIYAIKCHPTETNLFLSGGWDNSVKVWDVRTHAAIRSIKCPLLCGDGVDVTGNNILTTSWQAENSLGIWDFPSGKLIKNIPVTGKYTKFDGEFLYTGRFFADDPSYSFINSNCVAVGGGGFTELLILDIRTEKVLQAYPSLKPIVCLDICGNWIAYGGKESIFRVAEVRLKPTSSKK